MKKAIGLGVAFAVLMIMALAPATTAYKFSANETQLQIINDLQGQDITKGELYEILQPELVEGLSEERQKLLYETKVNWPDYSKVYASSQGDSESTNVKETIIINTNDVDSDPTPAILMRHLSDITASGRELEGRSESWVVFPPYLKMPTGEITSAVCKLDEGGETGTVLAYETEGAEDTYNLKAEVSVTVSEPGEYFCHGEHYFTAPVGFTPPVVQGPTASDLVTVR
ncbi:hypothetical protein RJ40_05550 [Methanofollis aquaemaris]|uniref:Uncharacterized protein n=1 Tax=Methanofollis aquaemaris TaxID=126734 RepID=A0A8A3S5U4_9EURY|nr:hypothetical protein [Methanofollis aquaemaris]QSZ66996.1 hypothetical protein RJ40_05550 [Methanofollis aquaemaris]